MKVNDIEIKNGNSIPTYFLIEKLNKMYKDHEFWFIMGTDLLPSLHLWDEGKKFIANHRFVIQHREGFELGNLNDHPNWPPVAQLLDSTTIGRISSTEVRKRVKESKKVNVHGLITPNTIKYVLNNKLYKKWSRI